MLGESVFTMWLLLFQITSKLICCDTEFKCGGVEETQVVILAKSWDITSNGLAHTSLRDSSYPAYVEKILT